MAWTAPKTWVALEVLTAAELNTHVRDNLSYLKDEADEISSDLSGIATSGTLEKSAFPAGTIVQVVQAVKTDTFTTSSSSFVDVTGLSVTITPASASNKVLLLATVNIAQDDNNGATHVRLTGGNSDAFVGDTAGSRNRSVSSMNYSGTAFNSSGNPLPVGISYLSSPASTSATTFKVQILTTNTAGYVNRTANDSDDARYGRYASSIIALEVQG